ncbi:MAG: 30S ribosomal protein S17 [Deltaproteobacteria bacterium]|nr:30S ribosomal protein S17 [Deltaproteobacteria bacterium]
METTTEHKKTPKLRTGIVVKDKMQKTVVVEVVRRVMHPKYGKFVRKRLRYAADNPDNQAKAGDMVLIEETRPLSKTKRWRVREVTQKAMTV